MKYMLSKRESKIKKKKERKAEKVYENKMSSLLMILSFQQWPFTDILIS